MLLPILCCLILCVESNSELRSMSSGISVLNYTNHKDIVSGIVKEHPVLVSFLEALESVFESSVSFQHGYNFFSKDQEKCLKDMLHVFQNLNSDWSFQMLDSSGKVPSGMLRGNFLWMGRYEECLHVHIPPHADGTGVGTAMYCVATWNLSLPDQVKMPLRWLPIKTGICLPESCRSANFSSNVADISTFLEKMSLLNVSREIMKLDHLHCHEKDVTLDSSATFFLYFVAVYLFFVLCGSSLTAFQYFDIPVCSKPKCNVQVTEHFSTSQELNNQTFEFQNCDDDQTICEDNRHVDCSNTFQRFSTILKCFCVFSNGSKIIDISSSTNQLQCIHGIKFLSMAWVILGHTYIHNTSVYGNVVDLLRDIDTVPFQVVARGTFSVDAFFLISGFLLAYLFLLEADQKNGKINIGYMILHRLIRLTPVYMLMIWFKTVVFKYMGSGPFWGVDSDLASCQKNWWWNLLYINNFLPIDSMCAAWTWYLANDMQFFLVGIFLISVLWRKKTTGLVICCSIIVCSWAITFCISYVYDVIPLFVGISRATDYEEYKNRLSLAWNAIYSKPYCRIGPYIIGILLAIKLRNNKWNAKPQKMLVQIVGWSIATALALSVLFGVYHARQRPLVFACYNALSRSAFALSVAWVVHCCLSGNAPIVNGVLSWRPWLPLGRVTFCAYLLHPLLMSWYFESQKEPLHFTQKNMVLLYLGFLVLSFAAAFVASVLFEAPILRIEKMIMKKYCK